MYKKIATKGAYGFLLGITFSLFFSILVNILCGNDTFSYVYPKLTSYISNENVAAIIQAILCGFLGIIIFISMILFEITNLSLLMQTIIHFIITICLVIIPIFYLTQLSFSMYLIIFVLIYFTTWNIQYLIYRHKIKAINKLLNVQNSKNLTETKTKHKFKVIISIIILFLVIINLNPVIIKVKEYFVCSTDLSEVYIDGLKIGDSINNFNEKQYTETNRYENKDYNKIYEELMIYEEDNIIERIFGRSDFVTLTINQNIETNLEDIVSVLGENYIKANYDSEQLTKRYIYIDKENNIKMTIIYRETESTIEIVTVILSRFN